MNRTDITLTLIVVLTLLGAADATYLTVLKIEDEVAGAAISSVCTGFSETGCTIALESHMASVLGIPVSLIALATYLFAAGMAVRRWMRREDDFALHALKLISVGAVLYSLVLGTYSFMEDSWCPFCVGLYGINMLLLVATWSLDRSVASAIAALKQAKPLGISLVVWLVLVLGGHGIVRLIINRMAGDIAVETSQRVEQALALGSFPMPMEGAPAKGPEDAPIQIVEFADYQCPHCKKLFFQTQELLKQHPHRFRVAFRHNPLSDICHPMMPTAGHPRACAAAIAAECAHRQDLFWELSALLFDNQRHLEDSDIDEYAREAGLNMGSFSACLSDPTAKAQVARDGVLARQIGMAGTPATLINGFHFSGGQSVKSFEIIAKALTARLAQSVPPANPKWAAHQALLKAGPGSPPTPTVKLQTTLTAPMEIIYVGDVSTAERREYLETLWIGSAVLKNVARLNILVHASEACRSDAPPADDACTRSRAVACGAQSKKATAGVFGLVRVLKHTGTTAELIDSLEKGGLKDVRACVAGPGGALLAEQAAAAASAPPGTAWVDGYRLENAGIQDIDRFVAALLQHRDTYYDTHGHDNKSVDGEP